MSCKSNNDFKISPSKKFEENFLICGLQCLQRELTLLTNDITHLLERRMKLFPPLDIIFTPSSVMIPVPEKVDFLVSFIMNNSLDSKEFAITLNYSAI